jgi:uncharacterized membrane protein
MISYFQILWEFFKKEDKLHIYTLFLLCLAAGLVRIIYLNQPMRCDESATFLYSASKPLYIALTNYSLPNNHLFHTFFVHLSYLTFGDHPWVIRLPAFFAGLLLLPATYIVTRIYYNKNAAVLTVAFLASSSILIEYSTNARGYSMICLFTMLIIGLVANIFKNERSSEWILFVILGAFGLYTIPIMLYPLGITIVWLCFSLLYDQASIPRYIIFYHLFISIIAVTVVTFILYLPVLSTFGLIAVVANQFVTSLPWADFLQKFPQSVLLVWKEWTRDVPLVLEIVLIMGFFIALVKNNQLNKFRVPLVYAIFPFLIIILLIQRVVPYARVWLFLMPVFLLTSAAGISYFANKCRYNTAIISIVSIIICILININVVIHNRAFYSEGATLRSAKNIARFLKNDLRSGDYVIVAGCPIVPLEYYFNRYKVAFSYLYPPNEIKRYLVASDKYYSNVRKECYMDLGKTEIIYEDDLGLIYEIKNVNKNTIGQ